MSDNEMELLNIIRKSEDPAKALTVAVQIITCILQQDTPRTRFGMYPGNN